MSLTMYQVDAFTERPFAGNPAAVFVLPGPRDERWLQDVAREMNLSETAFLVKAAHCCLGPYWGAKLDRSELTAYQASARGGLIRIRLGGDRVFLSGRAVTVLRGEFLG